MISMLLNDTVPLPAPKKPAFFISRDESRLTTEESKPKHYSVNNMTITTMDGYGVIAHSNKPQAADVVFQCCFFKAGGYGVIAHSNKPQAADVVFQCCFFKAGVYGEDDGRKMDESCAWWRLESDLNTTSISLNAIIGA
ncbi:bulb-type lectin domain-containing protein [Artemisia annua]|uniref:Bulb-type lectin domain-containing protein n=1 Tax=Artemisia annua TaxID=35608 RepID=A0A2U1LBT2_ARTAN|nr:bulb-type lectin domain-containing protein [Artemisia annua]